MKLVNMFEIIGLVVIPIVSMAGVLGGGLILMLGGTGISSPLHDVKRHWFSILWAILLLCLGGYGVVWCFSYITISIN